MDRLHRRSIARYGVRGKTASGGFEQVEIEPTRVYKVKDARQFLTREGVDVDAIALRVDGKFISAFVRATKPAASRCVSTCGS